MREKIELILLSLLIFGGLTMAIVGIVNIWWRHIFFGAIVYLCASVAFYSFLICTAEDYEPKFYKLPKEKL